MKLAALKKKGGEKSLRLDGKIVKLAKVAKKEKKVIEIRELGCMKMKDIRD